MSLPELQQNPLVQRVIDIFDEDGNGEVDFREFIQGISQFSVKGDKNVKLKCKVIEFSSNYYSDLLTKVIPKPESINRGNEKFAPKTQCLFDSSPTTCDLYLGFLPRGFVLPEKEAIVSRQGERRQWSRSCLFDSLYLTFM
ncbi:unnamed protein product [Strongylus vulgaris]|uniref:EF-hand domain-containing protein n=1 Tax=Strongylus vulgaris TaxID=40348 RepID=A0A3P7J4Z6_STRVU|nr:unnamed protein product [Strongylus vulgaris]